MGLYGQHWKFDGVPAAFVMRGSANGHYNIQFEREFASIEQIDEINWAHPSIEHLKEENELGLPDGYGFEVVNVSYYNGTRTYTVELKTARQYLGDVTEYQEQVAALEGTVAQQTADLAAKDAEIEAKDSLIADQAAEIAGLAADSAAALRDDMAEAYTEGVETVG